METEDPKEILKWSPDELDELLSRLVFLMELMTSAQEQVLKTMTQTIEFKNYFANVYAKK